MAHPEQNPRETGDPTTILQEVATALGIDISGMHPYRLNRALQLVSLQRSTLRTAYDFWRNRRGGGLVAVDFNEHERFETHPMNTGSTEWHRGMTLRLDVIHDRNEPPSEERPTLYHLTESGLGIVEIQGPGFVVLEKRALDMHDLETAERGVRKITQRVEEELGTGAIDSAIQAEADELEAFIRRWSPPVHL